jgi:hypothetical protein
MLITDFLTPLVFHFIVSIGLLLLIVTLIYDAIPFLNKVPGLSAYKLPAQVIAILLLVIGVYFEGAISNQEKWEKKVAEAEAEVLQLQIESGRLNLQLSEKLAAYETVREGKKNVITKIIQNTVTHYDTQCKLSNSFVGVHNSASQDTVPTGPGVTDENPSNAKPSEVLQTVIENYSTYYELRNQLIGWQEWYTNNQKLFDQ